jgi:hypothetical protein
MSLFKSLFVGLLLPCFRFAHQNASKKLFIQIIFDPRLPFEKGNTHFDRLFVKLIGVNCANGVHMGAIKLY